MLKIYISYRRQDSAPYAGRLAEALERHFGDDAMLRPERLFAAGEDWVKAQRRILRS